MNEIAELLMKREELVKELELLNDTAEILKKEVELSKEIAVLVEERSGGLLSYLIEKKNMTYS